MFWMFGTEWAVDFHLGITGGKSAYEASFACGIISSLRKCFDCTSAEN